MIESITHEQNYYSSKHMQKQHIDLNQSCQRNIRIDEIQIQDPKKLNVFNTNKREIKESAFDISTKTEHKALSRPKKKKQNETKKY